MALSARTLAVAAAVLTAAATAGCSTPSNGDAPAGRAAPPIVEANEPDDAATLTRCRVDKAQGLVLFSGTLANPHQQLRTFLVVVDVTVGGAVQQMNVYVSNVRAGGRDLFRGTAPAGRRASAARCKVADVASQPS